VRVAVFACVHRRRWRPTQTWPLSLHRHSVPSLQKQVILFLCQQTDVASGGTAETRRINGTAVPRESADSHRLAGNITANPSGCSSLLQKLRPTVLEGFIHPRTVRLTCRMTSITRLSLQILAISLNLKLSRLLPWSLLYCNSP